MQQLDADEFLKVLNEISKPTLRDIFGPDLDGEPGKSLSVPEGKGVSSLGVLRSAVDLELEWNGDYRKHAIRLHLRDPDLGERNVPVTDIRLWGEDQATPEFGTLSEIASRLEDCYLAVGLTRAWAKVGPSKHWLQVNNIFPINDPLWARD